MDFLDDEPTPEERQAALVQALQARMGQKQQEADFSRGWGNMNLRSGDRVLGALGQSQIQQAQHMDGQGAGLMRALQARRGGVAKSEEELDGIRALAEYRRSLAAGGGVRPADPLRQEELRLKIEKRKRDLSGDPNAKGDKDEVYKWSGRIPAGTKDGLDSIGRMEAIAAKYGGVAKVPGVGMGEGFLPGQALPKEADEFRRTGLAVISKYRNKMFGASLTPGEQAAFKQIADLGGSATAAQVVNAMNILKKGFSAGAQEALAGAPEHAKGAIFKDIGVPYGARPDVDLEDGGDWSDEDEAKFQAAEAKAKAKKAAR